MAKSPEEYAHLEWLGYVQPIGLIVSVPAMLEAQCYINKNIIGEHARFLECLPRDKNDEIIPEITDFAAFASKCGSSEEFVGKRRKHFGSRVEWLRDSGVRFGGMAGC